MGFATLKDVIPGAFAAAMLKCFFPRGLTEFGTPQSVDIGLGVSSPVCNRQMPYWSLQARRENIPSTATPTERLYLQSVPIRISTNMLTSMNPNQMQMNC